MTSRLALRAGLLSIGAASYLTTGRSLSRLAPTNVNGCCTASPR